MSDAPPAVPSRWSVWRRVDWAPFRDAADDLPPPGAEAARALLIGVLGAIAINAVAIALVVPWPPEGVRLRLMHHLFDALELAAAAVCLALPLWLWARLGWRKGMLGWLAYAGLCALAMYHLLDIHLKRQASSLLDGKFYAVLLPTYVVLCGLAVVAAHYLGAYFARLGELKSRWYARFGAALGLGGMVVSHAVVRDDYAGVHAAITWGGMALCGGSLSLVFMRRYGERLRRSRRGVSVASAALALLGILVPPPNRVRQELFREAGAVAPWVLAQVAWRVPAVDVAAPAPQLVAHDLITYGRATLGTPRAPVVVMITIDALRGDVIADRRNDARFPRLAWLRDNGAWFPNASSPGSQTSVSLSSLFTGRYFSQLYWRRFGEGKKRFHYAADDPTQRWPEALTAAGISTHSVIGLTFLQGSYGIARGFRDEQVVVEGRRHAAASQVMGPLLHKLRRAQGLSFFYAHLMEPHEPYDRGKLKSGSDFERYLSEIEVVDEWMGRLIDTMRRVHDKRAIIIVSSDHGEAFGEHGTQFHTKTLYEEMVHVPLIIWGHGIMPRELADRVSLLDVGPTVLHLFRMPPPVGSSGLSLLPLIALSDGRVERPVFSEGRLRRAMYTRDNLKVIEDGVRRVVEAYDLSADPDELLNLFDSGDERVHRAVAELRAWYAVHTLRYEGYEPPYKP